uniref:Uncharacterized protein n=1 Tax=Chromera velia CCMP2878 TaxID=1169474 RepID=A0A0G4HVF0_9ALVE|eukprot:Cvel_8790.t1-p1 / transcript=Cvel_8790.t1 / gene=Cvel_8790 / organism=Chromera_velia_CCMP2878 / gene_product=hypothetical protein / transcript_product=hypothetical protein / location=Cvel_scaffold492:25135-33512(+) / protein_length=406 / sequence_SO=supercontig / SO=protein_coding / is_pseudo=false
MVVWWPCSSFLRAEIIALKGSGAPYRDLKSAWRDFGRTLSLPNLGDLSAAQREVPLDAEQDVDRDASSCQGRCEGIGETFALQIMGPKDDGCPHLFATLRQEPLAIAGAPLDSYVNPTDPRRRLDRSPVRGKVAKSSLGPKGAAWEFLQAAFHTSGLLPDEQDPAGGSLIPPRDTGTSHRRYQVFPPEIPVLPTGETGSSYQRYQNFPPEIPGLPTGDTGSSYSRYQVFPPEIPGLPTGDAGSSHRVFPLEIPGLPTGETGTFQRRYRDFSPEISGLLTRDTGTSHRRYWVFPCFPMGDTGTSHQGSSHRRYQVFPCLPTGDTGTSHRRYRDFPPEIPGLPTRDTRTSDRRYRDFPPEIPGLPTGDTGTSHRRYRDFPPEIPGLPTGDTGTSHRRYWDLGCSFLFL